MLSIFTFILGVIASYLISRNFELKTQIRMNINSFAIINDNVGSGDIKLVCNGTTINTLTKTSIMFWNSGRKCITKDEILGDKCLKIDFSQGVKIFECKNTKYNEGSNKIAVNSNENFVVIDFDHLKPGNGAIIDVLHDGNIDNEITPILNLKTYNKNDIIKVSTSINWENIEKRKENNYRINKVVNAFVLLLFSIAATVAAVFLPLMLIEGDIAIFISFSSMFICGGLFVLLLLYFRNTFYFEPRDLHRSIK